MWEHDGVCGCGRRTYLFGQCFRCLKEEADEAEKVRAEAELDVVEETSEEKVDEALAEGQASSGLTSAALKLPEVRGVQRFQGVLLISDLALSDVLQTNG